jgi:hypothetical protein
VEDREVVINNEAWNEAIDWATLMATAFRLGLRRPEFKDKLDELHEWAKPIQLAAYEKAVGHSRALYGG